MLEYEAVDGGNAIHVSGTLATVAVSDVFNLLQPARVPVVGATGASLFSSGSGRINVGSNL